MYPTQCRTGISDLTNELARLEYSRRPDIALSTRRKWEPLVNAGEVDEADGIEYRTQACEHRRQGQR